MNGNQIHFHCGSYVLKYHRKPNKMVSFQMTTKHKVNVSRLGCNLVKVSMTALTQLQILTLSLFRNFIFELGIIINMMSPSN